MLNIAKQWNAKGNLFNRVVTARAIGMVGVTAGSLADATGHTALCLSKTLYAIITGAFEMVRAACGLKGRVNPLGLKHWNKEEAAIHARQAVVHVGIAAVAPMLGFVGPSAAQVPAIVFCRVKKPTENGFFAKVKEYLPTRKAALIGAGIASAVAGGGYAAQAHKYDHLPNLPAMPESIVKFWVEAKNFIWTPETKPVISVFDSLIGKCKEPFYIVEYFVRWIGGPHGLIIAD